ncbi:DUF5370 family protein [Cytobacillus sp. S13-E01]|uniref:DUF5370 family protein n=1 Tax=Cytobacillus sp. S13-E01 TaxID=3031326 RepID=UPI0023D87C89|nr:DUF5370 family protein [Cytobacillus sp. S13-E01]MDF0725436.1 DUF5370 family protein [Cytobacillus sp. S13-E01]
MGAIDRDGYRFETEYSVIHQDGALHVYKDGDFIKEITFSFPGEKPSREQIEKLVDEFFEE